jgi:hypothetical protein
MGVNASRVRMQQDKAASVTLRDIADGAESATATETAVSLNLLKGAYWQDGHEIPEGVFEIGVDVSAAAAGTGATYDFSIVGDDTANLSDSPVTLFSVRLPVATGFYRFVLDSKTIMALDTDQSGSDYWIAAKITLGGSDGSITYGAWIGKCLAP